MSDLKTRSLKKELGAGVMEALMAILIFSIAAFGTLSMISTSMKETGAVAFRTTAATAANDMMGKMASMARTQSELALYALDEGTEDLTDLPSSLASWLVNLRGSPGDSNATPPQPEIVGLLPNADARIQINGSTVSISVFWRVPDGEKDETGAWIRDRHVLTSSLPIR